MNKLQAMEVFVQVVDAGGFTRAADNLQLPKATVSTLVQALEQELQVKLLHRTTRQISVTADGAAYYERCLRILNDVRDAEEALSRNRISPSGRLRVDVSTALANNLLIPALPGFTDRYPDIVVELGCSDRTVDLIEESVDCAIRGGDLGDSTLIARRVGVVDFITCAAPSYLARFGAPMHPNDLLGQHRSVSYFSPKTGRVHEWEFVRGGERLVLLPRAQVRVNDSTAYQSAGLSGLGVVRMATVTAAPFLASGQLVRLLPDWLCDPMPVQVVYPQNRHLSAKVRVFVEWIADLFAQYPLLQMQPLAPNQKLETA
jgi:LysR family transcriptional regulator for bpeEF and oprC